MSTATEARPASVAERTEASARRRLTALHAHLDDAERGGATVVRIEHVRAIVKAGEPRG